MKEVVRGGDVVGYFHSNDDECPHCKRSAGWNRVKLFQFATEFTASCIELSRKKNADYASEDDPFGNLRRHGVQGIITRMDDKMARLANLTKPGAAAQVTDESIEVTIKDLLNYCWLLAGLIREGKSSQ